MIPVPEVIRDYFDKTHPIHQKIAENYYYALPVLRENYPETEILGKGSTSLVIGHPYDPSKVVKYFHSLVERNTNPVYTAEIFHVHRILSALFPFNFPEVYTVQEAKYPYMISERIYPSNLPSVLYQLSECESIIESLGLPASIENEKKNIIVAEDGGEYYVDLAMFANYNLMFERFDEVKALDYARSVQPRFSGLRRQNPYSLLSSSLDRLKEIRFVHDCLLISSDILNILDEYPNYDFGSLEWLKDSLVRSGISISNRLQLFRLQDELDARIVKNKDHTTIQQLFNNLGKLAAGL